MRQVDDGIGASGFEAYGIVGIFPSLFGHSLHHNVDSFGFVDISG